MATKTYYAKLDCFHSTGNKEHIAGEAFKSFCDFMTYISGSNRATLITWNSGSGAPAGSFESRTYWDGALPFGRGAHAVWRINSDSNRPWDWYLYAQVVSGSAVIANESFNVPIVSYGSALLNASSDQRGIALQAAVCFSGSNSFNPWNGTISQGNSTAGNPRWASGSNARTMYVLPRSNDAGGSHATSRNNSVSLCDYGTSNTSIRSHMIFDGDAFSVYSNINDDPNDYKKVYVGPFELRGSLSGSGICGGQLGFIMYRDFGSSADLPAFNVEFGDALGTSTTRNGGVAAPIGSGVSGSRGGILQVGSGAPFNTTVHQPNYFTGNYDEFPITVGASESPNFAFLGQMNYGLARTVIGPATQDTNADLSRAILAGNNGTITDYMTSIPWSGSLGPGVSLARTGSNFTWTKDYG